MTGRGIAIAATAAIVLVVPAAAQAATTKEVYMGEPPTAVKALEDKYGVDVDNYFPQAITVHAGDSVRFIPVGFHTVDLPGKGQKGQAILAPLGPKVAGEVDAAGAPFWFNGLPQLGLNPALLKGSLGKKVSYTGAARVDSGLPFARKPKPMVVKFSKAGTFTYFCDVHLGMKGTVKVVAASKPAASAKADDARVDKQVAGAIKVAKGLVAATKVPANTFSVGAVGGHGIEFFGFVPGKMTVPVGTTVTFRMAAGSVEDHTATTGPGDPVKDPSSYLGKIAAAIAGPAPFPGQGVYPSELIGGPLAQLSPVWHGNGFWSSGAMDAQASTVLPNANAVTFAAPGQYDFYCMIHPFMHAVVVVQ